ncbi:hypothetical protein J4443_01525 [Candidatus Woesearchaeota archaeon]|nr:hypothetical protein [Candidatus Woesearchaeota archaeon]
MKIEVNIERLLLLFTFFILINSAAAQEEIGEAELTDEDSGITPDSFLWGLDKSIDRLSLLLTFDDGKKARKGLKIARERLLEVKAMAEENKLEHAEKAKEEHGNILDRVKQNIENIKKDNSEDEIKEVIEIENEVEMYDDEVEQTFDELKIRIEVRGDITEEQREMINSILNSLKGQTGDVEISVKNKKDRTKTRIKEETGKDDAEIEEDIEDIEESADVKGREGLEKALELRIEHVKREIEKSESYLEERNREELKKHLELAREILDEAANAIDKNEVEHAKELILRALKLAVSVRGEDSKVKLEAKKEKFKEIIEKKDVAEERKELLKREREELKENEDEDREEEEIDEGAYFTEKMENEVINKKGRPIEGFTPSMFLDVFPKLEKKDFHNVEAFGGIYHYTEGELKFEMSPDRFSEGGGIMVSSADGTIGEEDMEKLLESLSQKFGIRINGKGSVDSVMENLR